MEGFGISLKEKAEVPETLWPRDWFSRRKPQPQWVRAGGSGRGAEEWKECAERAGSRLGGGILALGGGLKALSLASSCHRVTPRGSRWVGQCQRGPLPSFLAWASGFQSLRPLPLPGRDGTGEEAQSCPRLAHHTTGPQCHPPFPSPLPGAPEAGRRKLQGLGGICCEKSIFPKQ